MGLLTDIGDFFSDIFGGGTSSGTAATPAGTAGAGTTGILGTVENFFSTGTTAAEDTASMFGSVTAFMEALSDGRMWRSLGWLMLGLLLIFLSLYMWAKGVLAPPVRPRQPGAY